MLQKLGDLVWLPIPVRRTMRKFDLSYHPDWMQDPLAPGQKTRIALRRARAKEKGREHAVAYAKK